jgi:hypothetical protein
MFVGPIEIADANVAPSEQSAVRDYVRCTGNCPVESESELISKSNQSTFQVKDFKCLCLMPVRYSRQLLYECFKNNVVSHREDSILFFPFLFI